MMAASERTKPDARRLKPSAAFAEWLHGGWASSKAENFFHSPEESSSLRDPLAWRLPSWRPRVLTFAL